MNGDPSNKKNQFIYTLFYSVLVVLTAQINVHLFTRNFVASAGVIVFALRMRLLVEFAAMPVMFLSATGVMVTRSIAGAGKVLTSAEIWKTGMPEFPVLSFSFSRLKQSKHTKTSRKSFKALPEAATGAPAFGFRGVFLRVL